MAEPDGKAAPQIRPLDVDGVTAMTAGTVAWMIALLVLVVFFRQPLADNDASWWIWVCVTGVVIGLIGLPYVIRRRATYRKAAADRT